ncbi:putative transmembrane protein PGPGW [Melghirimyces profundicolus]|uniref:Putative transmembrane protein PGPGW n=1 Tax=Melghirimyces profundicolus TaxID=1242148 RepID=A0A2T6C9F4_9BACL|nr:PGPGW domain-containing protein [Melghirimyces profundicolus]PTX64944.1 putative transmembrane protein PGPGW [Melghirimyces profundicolus]
MNKQQMKRLVGRVIGWFLVLLGIIGMIFPVLHGVIFFLAGLLILSKTSPWAKNLLQKLESRFPKVAKQMDKLREHPKLKRIIP